jgi:predicted nucleotidyltransferase
VIDYLNAVAEISKERKKYFQNYKYYARLIKDAVNFTDVEVVVFGSVPEGEYTMASDIDVLIISDDVPVGLNERAKILSKINKMLGYFHPFELHLVTKKEAEWYKGTVKRHAKV